jgi:hypothetical protein
MYDYVCAWLGTTGDWGRIDFDDQNGTWFQLGVSSISDFWLKAYDSSGYLLDSDTTGACTQWEGYTDMVFLRVDAPLGTSIAYVKVYDSGNYWEVDNMSGDMAGGIPPIPEPTTIFLLGFGLLGLLGIGFRQRRRNK